MMLEELEFDSKKIVIFFTILTLFAGFFGLPFSIITVVISLGILSLGFFGALRRNTCMLKAYGIIRILELIFHFLMLIVALIIIFLMVGILLTGGYEYDTYFTGEPNPIPIPLYNNQPDSDAWGGEVKNTYMKLENDYVVQSNPMMPLPLYEIGAYGNYYAGIYTNVVISYYNQLTISQIIAVTMIGTGVFVTALFLSLLYYALVIYTVVLTFRMSGQLKQSTAVYNAVAQKEFQLTTENNQPFIYVVADPSNGNQPVVLHPVDPTVYMA